MSNSLINRPVGILSRSRKCWLDGRQDNGANVLLPNKNPAPDHYLQWIIGPYGNAYCIRSVSSGGWLDGRGESGSAALVTRRPPYNAAYLQW